MEQRINNSSHYIESLEFRGASLGFARHMAYAHMGITANSWETLASKADHATHVDQLEFKRSFLDSVICGNKSCNIYKANENINSIILKQFEQDEIDSDSLHFTNYPASLEYEDLKKADNSVQLMYKKKVVVNEETIYIFNYCTKETYSRTIELSSGHLKEETVQDLDSDLIDSVKVLTKVPTQLFNTLILNESKNYLLLMADVTGLSSGKDSENALHRFKLFIKSKYGIDFPKAINVFPFIEPLYQTSKGRVTKTDFVTPSDNISRISIKKGEKDIRTDSYHKAGEEEVGELEKFKITKAWEFVIGKYGRIVSSSISINGDKKLLHNGLTHENFELSECYNMNIVLTILRNAFNL